MGLPSLDTLRSWFAAYCRGYYGDDPAARRNIVLKEGHTARVCDNMDRLTASLDLDSHERHCAAVVALFHDLGRFEQYRRFGTFRDADSVDHAQLGVRVLAEEGLLRDADAADRAVILQSIALHNRFALPDGLDYRGLLLARLIRDADKLDIWQVFVEFYAQPEEERASAVGLGFPDEPHCSAEVVRRVLSGEMVRLDMLRTLNDFKLLQLSWVFDLNFPASYRIAAERDLVGQLALTLPQEESIERAVAVVRRRLVQCMKEDVAV